MGWVGALTSGFVQLDDQPNINYYLNERRIAINQRKEKCQKDDVEFKIHDSLISLKS
jgi:hypothetical protein